MFIKTGVKGGGVGGGEVWCRTGGLERAAIYTNGVGENNKNCILN